MFWPGEQLPARFNPAATLPPGVETYTSRSPAVGTWSRAGAALENLVTDPAAAQEEPATNARAPQEKPVTKAEAPQEKAVIKKEEQTKKANSSQARTVTKPIPTKIKITEKPEKNAPTETGGQLKPVDFMGQVTTAVPISASAEKGSVLEFGRRKRGFSYN